MFCSCRFTHDLNEYLTQKPRDIPFPTSVDSVSPQPSTEDSAIVSSPNTSDLPPSVDPSAFCPVYQNKGECKQGYKCRFLGAHIRKTESGSLEPVKDEDKVARRKLETTELNFLPLDALKRLRSKKV